MTVRQMAILAHPTTAVRRVLAVLKAYFDESGLHSTEAFAISGFIAPEKEWSDFETEWDKILQNPAPHPVNSRYANFITRPLEYLHAAEMEKLGTKRFRLLGQRNRDYLKAASMKVITTPTILGMGSAIVMESYRNLSDGVRDVIGEPYMLCFQHAIVQAANLAKHFLLEDPSEDIAFIFERHPRWQIKANQMWLKMIDQGFAKRYRMGTLTFACKEKFKPLQAADRLAYETYQHFTNPIRRPEWETLTACPTIHGRYFNDDGFASFQEELRKSGKI